MLKKNQKKRIGLCQSYLFSFILIFSLIRTVYAGFGVKYEPPDGKVLHGLGQYISVYYSDEENWQMVADYQAATGQIPVLYSVYASIDPLLNSIDFTDFTEIISAHQNPYILVVGLGLLDSTYALGNTNIPVQDILSGKLDKNIIQIADRIKSLNYPVFIRPGFEFGSGNDGLHSDPDLTSQEFVSVWIYIYNVFQEENVVNVSWVWNTVNPQSFNYLDWYPGDQYVDWWGINYFTAYHIENSDQFLADALSHQKPIMICESCPIQDDGTLNEANLNDWFAPYFEKIHANSHIKAFVYISDPWDRGPFSSWPDSRISANEVIRTAYAAELNDYRYIHMSDYFSTPEMIGGYAHPFPVIAFNADASENSIDLTWKMPADSLVKGVRILRKTDGVPTNPADGLILFDSTGTTFADTNIVSPNTYYYAAYTFDETGKYSEIVIDSLNMDEMNPVEDGDIPVKFSMSLRNYPNPFNASTVITWEQSKPGVTEIILYNILGEKIQSVYKNSETAGSKRFRFNAENLPSGIYFAALTVTSINSALRGDNSYMYRDIIKMIVLK
ncbi:MAG: T9SS type A sorting domain-containing protein [Calditrichaceae bacterium]